MNYVPWAIVAFVFNYVIRRRHFSWWTKYNYILSAGLDAGVAIAVIIIFFTLQYPRDGSIGNNTIKVWWGNVMGTETADARSATLLAIPDKGWFGPETW